MPNAPSRATQVPLSGRQPDAGQVIFTQRTTNSGGGNTVNVIDSSVMTQGVYSGSETTGKASGETIPLTLESALAMGLRENLGALSQSAGVQLSKGQREVARSELLPQVNTVVSEAFEKINIRTLGVEENSFPLTSKFNFDDARAARLIQSVFDLVKIRNLHSASENAGECDRQLREGGAASAGADTLQAGATGCATPGSWHVGCAKGLNQVMPGGGWKPKHSPWLIAVAVMIATFMEVMDTPIASVAVPYIADSTASTTDEAEWVLTVYLVANAVFLPASNYFAERFGRKKFLMFSIALFTVASFLCRVAPSLAFILITRAIQGAGGGALQPLSQAILLESFPPAKQGQALGLYALGVVLAPVFGPALGGYLTDAVSWRWAFYINIPVGILALLLQSKFLEDPPEFQHAKPGKFDGVGFGMLGLWIGCLHFILDKGQEDDWLATCASAGRSASWSSPLSSSW